MCNLKDFEKLKLDPAHKLMLEGELPDWHETYLPRDSLKDKTVLDIGAGNGETPQFYFNHDASKVIAIESLKDVAKLCSENFPDKRVLSVDMDDYDLLVIRSKVGFIKSDCEGGEKDMFVETHFPVIIKPVAMSKISCANTNGWKFYPIPFGEVVWPSWLVMYQLIIQVRSYVKKTKHFLGWALRW